MDTYDNLRRQCRTLESLLDAKLSSYSRLAANIGRGQDDVEAEGSSNRWKDLQHEIDDLLEKLGETNDQLYAILNDPNSPPAPPVVRTIQRHRDAYNDYAKETQRSKVTVQAALDRANLLTDVRNDIDAFRSSSAGEALLAERGRIDSSHRMTDDVLAQAYETREEFSRQRSYLAGINTRMQGVISTLPGINSLLSMIKSRRRRDSIIIGCVMGVCIILLLNYIAR